jgi:hypothetical protein
MASGRRLPGIRMSLPLRVLGLLFAAAALSACTQKTQTPASGSGPAGASSTAPLETYCNLEGYSAPARQTIVVLDEADMGPETVDHPIPANEGWHRLLDSLLSGDETALARVFEPRERVRIAIARLDGAGIRPVFEGCMPFFSAIEKKAIATGGGVTGMLRSLSGEDPLTTARKALASFQKHLHESIFEAVKSQAFSVPPQETDSGTLATSPLVTSLRQAGTLVKLDQGVPRVIIYSDMTRYAGEVPASVTEARKAGEHAGYDSRLDFKGADVHVVGLSPAVSAREMLDMFFLACHGELLSAGPADNMPSLDPGPISVARYQGKIKYPDRQFVIRIRLATDADGHVMSSWLSARTTSRDQFVPFHGKMDCEGESCTFTGDHVFAQLWNPAREPGKEPDPQDFRSLTFAGLRDLAFTIKDRKRLTGSISDPAVRLSVVDSLKFNATPISDLF